jgi:adenine/guanine phosphoribosyltransferase-like PRPP-binding protein
VTREECPAALSRRVKDYEEQFSTQFARVVIFDIETLHELHRPGTLSSTVVHEASATDRQVTATMDDLTDIANTASQADGDRRRYLESLQHLLTGLGRTPLGSSDEATTVIAPRREGAILAERLGFLDQRPSWTPQAKRIHLGDGLAVGLDEHLPTDAKQHIVLIDGVVASGATILAILSLIAAPGATVEVLTCHGTREGILALTRYAELLQIRLTIRVGHVSGVLNDHFYAVDPQDPQRLILGDIGDTIGPICSPAPAETVLR